MRVILSKRTLLRVRNTLFSLDWVLLLWQMRTKRANDTQTLGINDLEKIAESPGRASFFFIIRCISYASAQFHYRNNSKNRIKRWNCSINVDMYVGRLYEYWKFRKLQIFEDAMQSDLGLEKSGKNIQKKNRQITFPKIPNTINDFSKIWKMPHSLQSAL